MKILLLLPAIAALALTALLLLYPSPDPAAGPAPPAPGAPVAEAPPPVRAAGRSPRNPREAGNPIFEEFREDERRGGEADREELLRAYLAAQRRFAERDPGPAGAEAEAVAGDGTGATAGAAADAEEEALPDGYGAYVTGTVTRAGTGEPVSGCSVAAYPGGRHTETAEDGTYSVGPLPPGEFHLLAVSIDGAVRRVGPVRVRGWAADVVAGPAIELPAR